jgi:predicted AlkP superfamily pyrophosphatase or phosphodiesterase
VFVSALSSITGKQNSLGLPRVKNACVIMVDGLGAANIEFRSGHAPLLSRQLQQDGFIQCGFPSTTVSSLASFSTGVRSGVHGMVGYQILDRDVMSSINLLTGITTQEEATKWQPRETVAQQAAVEGVEVFFVGPAEYEKSGFTMATMRGAKYAAGKSIEDRFIVAQRLLATTSNVLVYLYIPELDQKAHAFGSKSVQWVEKLEDLESALKKFVTKCANSTGILLTADHGIVDVAAERQIFLDEIELPALISVGGDPRVLFLYFNSAKENINETQDILQKFLGKRAYVATRDELISAGWFGNVQDFAAMRLPELFVIALGETALYHRSFAKPKSLKMVGQHGSISSDELNVPLLRFAGYAKK